MTKHPRQMLAIALAGVAVGLAAGCGGSDEPEGKGLPPATASELERRLDEIERRYRDAVDNGNPGACEDIQNDSIPAANELVSALPQDVDPDVRQAVEESFSRLEELTQSECSGVKPADTAPEPDPAPVPEETVPEETVPEETVPEQTEQKPPKEKKPKENKDDGGGAVPPGVDPSQPGQGGGAVPGGENG